jgi:hypothetical protein
MEPLQSKPPLPDESDLDDPVLHSRATYVMGFAGVGLVFGAMAMLKLERADAMSPLMLLFASSIGGAIVGLELHATLGWIRHGPLANLGRWVLAFASAAALVGSTWRVFGVITLGEFYLLLVGAAIGGGVLHLYLEHSDEKKARARKS